MRPDSAGENGVSIVQEVLRRDGRGDARPRAGDELGGTRRRDVLEHHLEPRESLDQRRQQLVDEHRLAIEYVDLRARRLAVHQEGESDALHALEHGVGLCDVGDAGLRMRGRSRRIKLHAVHDCARTARSISVGRGGVRQVQRHERLESASRGERLHDPGFIGRGLIDAHDRRPQVRHHDRAAEPLRREFRHGGKPGPVAQVHVPVIRAANR